MKQSSFAKGSRPVAVVPKRGVFTGYASHFNQVDSQGDMVMPGAFRDSLKQRGVEGIRMLFQHDPKEVIGSWVEIAEDEKGLRVRGRLNPDVQRGRELAALLDQRALDGLSIGFRTVFAHRDKASGVRRLHRIDLWEVSLVTFPMLANARIDRLKAEADKFFKLESMQQGVLNPWT
jgi:HK97 family phage prohead protease